MSSVKSPSVEDVYAMIVDRLAHGSYGVGARLPSCRNLAVELGSNPSTVDRALGRLADQGVLRTVPRRGTYVITTEVPQVYRAEDFVRDVGKLIARARLAGLAPAEIRRLAGDAIARHDQAPKIAFLECNQRDLDTMAARITAISGFDVERRLLDTGDGPLDVDYDVVVTPYFHLGDVNRRVRDVAAVVAVNVTVSPHVLRRLATLDPDGRAVVVAPTTRGVERMSAVVRQFHAGLVDGYLQGTDDRQRLAGATAVVVSNASEIPADLDPSTEVIPIEWDIEPGFGPELMAKLDALGKA